MMKKILHYLLVGFIVLSTAIAALAQKVEKVIDMGIYTSYYSYTIKNPLYVTYKLYKGGGKCDRKKQGFNFAKCGEQTASNTDYTNSNYERGHLANAEDFASDCSLEKKTFCYYNCVPQTYELNHGKWLEWESKIRALSQTKALFIVTGSIFKNRTIKPASQVLVPESCYKIVIDNRTGDILHCLIFPNDQSKSGREISFTALKAMLSYPLVPQRDLSLYQ
jgi:endonuclease G